MTMQKIIRVTACLLAFFVLAEAKEYGQTKYGKCMHIGSQGVGTNVGVPRPAKRLPQIICHYYCRKTYGCLSFVYQESTDMCHFKNAEFAGISFVPTLGYITYDVKCMNLIYQVPKSQDCTYPGLDAPHQADLKFARGNRRHPVRAGTVASCLQECKVSQACNTFSYSGGRCYFKAAKPGSLIFALSPGTTFYNARCGTSIDGLGSLPGPEAYSLSPHSAMTVLPSASWGSEALGQVLGMNFKFYESLWSGRLPTDYRVSWRKPGYVGVCAGRDGGSYEAGNHIVSAIASSESSAILAGSLLHNRAVYANSEYEGKSNLHWATRELRRTALWLAQTRVASNKFLIATGLSTMVFEYFGRAENAPRPVCTYATPEKPASDHVAHTAAALGQISIVFKKQDPAFSKSLIQAAADMYIFSQTSKKTANDSRHNIGKLYPSSDSLRPEKYQFWAACSLYQATGEMKYYSEAKVFMEAAKSRSYWPVLNWDNPYWHGMLCLARSAPTESERKSLTKNIHKLLLDKWLNPKANLIFKTPGGFPYWNTNIEGLGNWGMIRDTSGTAYMCMMYADLPDASPDIVKQCHCFAKKVVKYVLGGNPLRMSYMAGYTSTQALKFPMQVHSRDAACPVGQTCSRFQFRFSLRPNYYTVVGGVVSGPDFSDGFTDRRDVYERTEIAQDFNSAFAATVAALANLPAKQYSAMC